MGQDERVDALRADVDALTDDVRELQRDMLRLIAIAPPQSDGEASPPQFAD